MTVHRYQPNRLGLFNFWYHTDSVFEFADGKLFVRGANGSGKSVTTTMAVPILLDGDKSPSRLDPFGGKSRLMVDLLLGERNISQKEEATGYLYFEFKKGGSYLTFGIGMYGNHKEQRSPDYWYFMINDGRRIGHDFLLYDEENIHGEIRKFPLTKAQLEEKIGRGGEFATSQARYTEMVNEHLFGFNNVKTFKELIHILIQLRSPKLSRDTKPTDVSNLLSDSLPELTNDELSPMILTIGTIDAHQEKLDELEKSLSYLRALESAYQTYNEYRLYEIAKENTKIEKQIHESNYKLGIDRRQLEQFETEFEELPDQLASLETEKQTLDMEERQLKGHEVFGLRQQQAQFEEEVKKFDENFKSLEEQYNKKRIMIDTLTRDRTANDYEKEKTKNTIDEIAEELGELAKRTLFPSHDQYLLHLEQNPNAELTIFHKSWEEDLLNHRKELSLIRQLAQEVETCRLREKDAEETVDRAEQQLEIVKKRRTELQKTAEYIREDLGKSVETWQAQVQVFMLKQNAKQQLIGLFESFLYEEIEDASREIGLWCSGQKQIYENSIIKEMEGKRFAIAQEKSQQTIWREQIEDIQNQVEIEPVYSKDEQARRNSLREQNVMFSNFYEAVDFRPEMDANVRENLEAAISRAGLLTALLVSEEDEGRILGLPILRTQQIKTQNLTQYLVAVSNEAMSQSQIERLLQGISISKLDGSYILDTGEFQNGFIHGNAPFQEEQFIGKAAREATRAKRILSLQDEVQSSQNRIEEADDQIAFLENQKRRLNTEFSTFPSLDPIREVEKQRKDLDTEEKLANNHVEQQKANFQTLKQSNQPIINEFLLKSAPYHRIEGTSTAYQNIINELNEYRSKLKDFFYFTLQRKTLAGKVDDASNRIDDLENDLIDLKEKQMETQRDLNSSKAKKDMILKLIINQKDEQNILARIDEIGLMKKEKENASRLKMQHQSDLRSDISRLKPQVEAQGLDVLDLEELKQAWESLFQDEKSFGFIDAHWTAPLVASNLESTYKELKISEIQEGLDRTIYDAEHELIAQNMKQTKHALKIRKMGKGREWEQLQQWSDRRFITFTPSYIEMKPIQLLRELQETRDETALAIQEKERQLYEKVLIDDIGSTIRDLIKKAKEWVEEANNFLSSIDTTIRMQLKWKPLPAKEQGELSTDKLVELLSKNTRWLNNHDLERITEHFKTKVDQARAMAKADTRFSLTDKMKELLDYRKWYRFVLYYQKEGQPDFDEFSNKEFEKMSGGEKGISMYSPLFAAAAAKYTHAASHSPRLFSLDEAFAGIDHDNIENIFGLISQFDFDYLMNSQILWGTYETVNKLSIVEILRRVHEKTLVLGRYYWDGENKHDLPIGHLIEEYFAEKLSG